MPQPASTHRAWEDGMCIPPLFFDNTTYSKKKESISVDDVVLCDQPDKEALYVSQDSRPRDGGNGEMRM